MSHPKSEEKRTWTYADYLTWPEDERWELIDGEAFDMTPGAGTAHQVVSSNLHGLLWQFFEGKDCKLFHAPYDVRLPEKNESDETTKNVVQPDILVVCDSNKLDEKGCKGAPDFVVEIISPSTSSKDHIRKKELYERHGVKEFWLIHPLDRVAIVYRLAPGGKFCPAQILAGDDPKVEIPQFSGLVVDFGRVYPKIPNVVRESPRKYLKKKNQD